MKVTILGTGAYGLALSKVLNYKNNEIVMWTAFDSEREELISERKSSKLPGYILDEKIKVTSDLSNAIINSKLIVIALPTAFISDVMKQVKKYITKNQYICIASKGIEQNSCMFINEIVKKILKTNNIGVISGPSFAIDLINDVPVGLSVASKNKKSLQVISEAFSCDKFKLYPTNDVIGIEICGAIKNVIAISSGMIDGMGYSNSTQALLITDSLHDIKKIIHFCGGNKNTILSLAGFGDILLTCTSEKSRNYTLGKLIGSRASSEVIDEYIKNNTIEGLYTLKSIYKLLKNKKIDAPIIYAIYDIVFNKCDVQYLVDYLMI